MIRHPIFAAVVAALLFSNACASCGGDNNGNNGTNNGTVTDPDMGGGDPDGGDPDGGGGDPDSGGDPDMGEEPPVEVPRVACADTIAPPAGDDLCEATTGSNGYTLLRAGEVLGPDATYENGGALVDPDGRIVCAGCDCGDEANSADATVISCAEGVLSPSLINPHDHITFSLSWPQDHGTERYEHRHDWRRGLRGHSEIDTNPGSDSSREGVLYGETRMLFGGATSIAGSSSVDASGFLRNLDDGARTEGLTGVDVDYRTFPLGDSGGSLRDMNCDYPDIDSESRAQGASVYLPHIAEGIDDEAANEFRCTSGLAEGGADLINSNTSVIHGIGLTAVDIEQMAAEGARLVWSPRSNIDLYGNTARAPIFRRYGVVIALGTDWSASGSMNVLRELQCADYLNSVHYGGVFSDYELWKMSTLNAAIAMGADTQIGAIVEGFFADLAIFDGRDRDAHRAVISAEIEDVHFVMRGGVPLLGDANVIEALVPAAEVDQCEEIDVCGERRRICAQRDIGMTLSQLRGSVDPNAYPLFFCETPEREPSCVPFREGEYDGSMAGPGDIDGDGIPDADDVCSAVFNPIRPMDGTMQPDIDQDGAGDECDECPTGDADSCPMFDPNDFDSDGVPNLMDNCPNDANPDQADSEGDGVGDVCDACSDFDNSTTPACPATIYEIRGGEFVLGDQVFIDEVVVTAAGGNALFVQVPADASYYNGVEFSGLNVFLAGNTAPAVGDSVRIDGVLSEFGGTLQIEAATITVNSSGNALPDFTEVQPSEIANGGARADELEGTLVQVRDVTVTDPNPDAPDDFGEFEITGGLRVDDLFYEVMPDPTGGEEFSILRGVATFSFGNKKMVPRNASDVVTGPASLVGLTPSTVFVDGDAGAQSTSPPLYVSMSGPTIADVTVALTYSGNVTGPASVTVTSGSDRAEVQLTPSGTGPGSVTASYDGNMSTANVTVYDAATTRTVSSLAPANPTVNINGNLALTVTIAPPASAGGQRVDLAYTPGTSISGPAFVTVPAGMMTAAINLTASATAGSETVTASIGGSSQSTTVNVTTAPANCLIISEYIEGSGSNNKAFELYNCSSGPLDLGNFAVCLVSNGDTTCSQSADLPTQSLPVGGVFTVCRSDTAGGGDPVDGIANNCNLVAANVANFNGNDRLAVYLDANGDSMLDGGDTVTDAFGVLATDPGPIWANTTYRRCDFASYDGVEPFSVDDRYTSHPQNDATDFGTAPVAGCP